MPCALPIRSEEHTSELQSHDNLVCRLLLEKKKKHGINRQRYVGAVSDTVVRCEVGRPSTPSSRTELTCMADQFLTLHDSFLFFFLNKPDPPEFPPFPHPPPLRS